MKDLHQAAMDGMTDVSFKASVGARVGPAVARAVPPPVALSGPAAAPLVDQVLASLNVQSGSRDAIGRKVLARMKARAAGKPVLDAAGIEDVVLQTLDDEAVRTPAMDAAAVQAALRAGMKPPGIVFADSNWGGGDHSRMFALVTNPMTGQTEMWEMNEDGSDPSVMDQDAWVRTNWRIPKDPASFGGI